MGCGSSTVEGEKPRKPAEKSKDEPVVAFSADEEDDDDISITPAAGAGGRNPKSAIAYAHVPTAEETQAAIERSLTLQEDKSRSNVSNEVGAFDEPQPFTDEQSPRTSPRIQKSFSNPDPVSAAVIKKYSQDDNTNYEKKHYFPDSSPTWEEKEDSQRQPVWSSSAVDPADGGKKARPAISIDCRPTRTGFAARR
eukprot:TRINITY_DN5290_c0_g1_i2.p1 TRINITY_DN5290_c0_g1~~TRINITY_DN5290_c0_g1_i2.p1  ORF type:complete len:195 (-),score=11.48 TRINITY_DN5290_c0_g1_i2:1047-1631(-)